MKVIQKALQLAPEEYYRKHLSIINPLLPAQLTEKEIQVLAAFLALDEKITEDDIFNSLARKKVMESLNLSPGGLSNYLKSMINKGFLRKSPVTNRITVKEFLVPENGSQGYQFKIQKKN